MKAFQNHNGEENSDNPWFYSTRTNSPYYAENVEFVSEEQARKTIEMFGGAYKFFPL